MERPITVLLLDGHAGVRAALAQRFQHAPGVGRVATALMLDAAGQDVRDHAPQVVPYDSRTVAVDAEEAVQRLQQVGG